MKSHLSVKLFMAKSIGIFVNNGITSSEMKENSSSICVFFSFSTNSKLFPMWLCDKGILVDIIFCKKVASAYSRLFTEETIILKGQLCEP